jgi:hypothetical protein
MMTLDGAIKRCTNNAEYERAHGNLQGCLDLRLLAEWLKVYKRLLEQARWIPTSKRLPKAGEYIEDGDVAKYYLVQNEYGDMMVARYTHSEYWEQIYKMKPIEDEIVAWRELPEPYVPETNVGNMEESEENK